MTWVRFHEELCETEKAGIPRETRFVYMELSLRARPRRGFIVLPQGMSDVKAVQLMLSGNGKQVAIAIDFLSSGSDPMIRFEDRDGKRILVVINWPKWNPTRDDSGPRVRRYRQRHDGDTETPSERNGNALPGDNETPVSLSSANASARARGNLLSSPLSDFSEIDAEERDSEVRLRTDERYVSKDDKLSKELRDAAAIIGVQDIETAWLSFCGKRDGQWLRVSGSWQSFCASWASYEKKERARRSPDGPTDPTDPYHAPESRKARDEAEARRRDAEYKDRRRDAVPPPADFLAVLGIKKAQGGGTP